MTICGLFVQKEFIDNIKGDSLIHIMCIYFSFYLANNNKCTLIVAYVREHSLTQLRFCKGCFSVEILCSFP